ncbi:MAG: sigma-E processing peptidase SpoIIGA [Firmicutes bacterium]|nr:sigma-E processing peptidase SpoIIGA [Bacillota bacterium]
MYVEDLLALNFMMNVFLLYLTARLLGRNVAKKRILAGGFLAALYSLAIYLPASAVFFSWAGKLLVSVIIVWFTFRPRRFVETLRLCGGFFLASFIVGGTVFALYFFTGAQVLREGGVFYLRPARPGVLFYGALITFFLLLVVWRFGEWQRNSRKFRFYLEIFDEGQKVTVNALVDTGNRLHDPFTGKPLCVASFHAVSRLLPPVLRTAYKTGQDPVMALGELSGEEAAKFGVAPFRALENAGVLLTYRPEKVILGTSNYREERQDLQFALTRKPLSLDDEAEVLLHPYILEKTGGVGY